MQQTAPTQPVIIKESAQKKKERRLHFFLHVGLLIYFFITLLPFVWTFMTSLKQSKDVAAAP
jgi:ABC-type glycerol-3-phosphate transport system permease component